MEIKSVAMNGPINDFTLKVNNRFKITVYIIGQS